MQYSVYFNILKWRIKSSTILQVFWKCFYEFNHLSFHAKCLIACTSYYHFEIPIDTFHQQYRRSFYLVYFLFYFDIRMWYCIIRVNRFCMCSFFLTTQVSTIFSFNYSFFLASDDSRHVMVAGTCWLPVYPYTFCLRFTFFTRFYVSMME